MTQTYRNIEIIIINDGSTDCSNSILGKLAREDNRIMIINQKNSGVSSARNVGLSIAHGMYITFVDGDDWLSKDFIEYMLSIIDFTKSEIAISLNNFTTRDSRQIYKDKIEIWTGAKTFAKFLYPGVSIGVWNKMFNHDFIKNNSIKFQEDMIMGEGMKFITDVAQYSKNVGVGLKKVYWYRQNNEISATTNPSIEHGVAAINSISSIEENIKISNPSILRAVSFHKWINNFHMLRILLMNKADNNYSSELYDTCLLSLKTNNIFSILEYDITISQKIKMIFIFIFPLTMAKTINNYKTYRLIHDRNGY
jgi:glycosyltransferase involved in cell wall biosynthesis